MRHTTRTRTWDDDGTRPLTLVLLATLAFLAFFSPANWEMDRKWTVPLELGVWNITTLGSQPVSVGITCFNNVVRPPGTGSSQLGLVTSFLFPKAPTK